VPVGTVIVVLMVVFVVLGLIGWKVFMPAGVGPTGTRITVDEKLGNPTKLPDGVLQH
jgi:hypothetical protein